MRSVTAIAALFCASALLLAPVHCAYAGAARPVVAVEDYLTGLNQCITIAFAPDGRMFFLEKTGAVRVVERGRLLDAPWAEIAVDSRGERGLLGIALDPRFEENGYVYLYHSVKGSADNRVVRLEEKDGRGVGPATVLEIEDFVPATNHNGGNIAFGPDGALYVTVGDGGGEPGRSQDETNMLGKILRIDVRGALPVRFDSPSDIIYAKGLRNSFDMAWNPANGALYATENGPVGRDEINKIVRGGDYGWPAESGRSPTNRHINPIWDFGPASVAPTGIAFYPDGGSFPRAYWGDMFVTDYNHGRVYRIRLSGDGQDEISASDFEVWMEGGFAGTTFADIAVGPDGALYLAGFTRIVRIARVP